MALGGLGQEALSSLTGNIETAYLIIQDFRKSAAANAAAATAAANQATAAFDSQIAQRAAGLALSQRTQAAIAQQRQRVGGAAGGGGALQPEARTLRVQFNPSEIQLYSNNLPSMESNATKSGPQSMADAVTKPKVSMTVSLYFDAMNVMDSFMWDKFTAGVSAQGITNAVSAAAKGKGKVWSVQAQVEGLVAALRNPHTRNIGFHWSDFSFEGQLIAVMAQYTMFSATGRPVRAKVTLRLQQELDPDKLGTWEADFKDAFGGGVTQAGRVGQQFGSLLNVGF